MVKPTRESVVRTTVVWPGNGSQFTSAKGLECRSWVLGNLGCFSHIHSFQKFTVVGNLLLSCLHDILTLIVLGNCENPAKI
jgi:hypothetical protein